MDGVIPFEIGFANNLVGSRLAKKHTSPTGIQFLSDISSPEMGEKKIQYLFPGTYSLVELGKRQLHLRQPFFTFLAYIQNSIYSCMQAE